VRQNVGCGKSAECPPSRSGFHDGWWARRFASLTTLRCCDSGGLTPWQFLQILKGRLAHLRGRDSRSALDLISSDTKPLASTAAIAASTCRPERPGRRKAQRHGERGRSSRRVGEAWPADIRASSAPASERERRFLRLARPRRARPTAACRASRSACPRISDSMSPNRLSVDETSNVLAPSPASCRRNRRDACSSATSLMRAQFQNES